MKRMIHRTLAALLCLVLCMSVLPPAEVKAAETVEYEFAFAIHSVGDDRYLRHVGPVADADTLHDDECYIIYMTIHNNSGQKLNIGSAVLAVDDVSYTWNDLSVGTALSLRFSRSTMEKISPGRHTCTLKLDGKLVYSEPFMMPRHWGSTMTLPTQAQLDSARTSVRSPYIAFYSNFPGSSGFTEYSIDVRTDHVPVGTYLCPIDWWMNLSSLEQQYSKIWADYGSVGGGYCGLQVWGDGTHGVIMTLWDVFCQDSSGNTRQIKAKVLYPENAYDTDHDKSSEGSFVHFSYPYDWEAGKDYRFLLQQSQGDNGNVLLTLWIMDLEAGRWTRLFCFDTGMQNIWIDCAGGFVENYIVSAAAQVRTMEIRNIRAHTRSTGQWVNAASMDCFNYFALGQGTHQGSYNYGYDKDSFWIITSGIEGLCSLKTERGPFPVPSDESGRPY